MVAVMLCCIITSSCVHCLSWLPFLLWQWWILPRLSSLLTTKKARWFGAKPQTSFDLFTSHTSSQVTLEISLFFGRYWKHHSDQGIFFRITWHRQYGIYCLFVIFYILYTIDYRLLFGFCFFPVLNLLPFLDDLWFSVFPKARLFNKRQGLLNHLKSKVLVFMPHPNSRCWSKKSQKKSWNGMFLYALKLEGAWL